MTIPTIDQARTHIREALLEDTVNCLCQDVAFAREQAWHGTRGIENLSDAELISRVSDADLTSVDEALNDSIAILRGEVPSEADPATRPFTVWVTSATSQGPTHISVQYVADATAAKREALSEAARALALPGTETLRVLGVANGDIDFDNWNDGY